MGETSIRAALMVGACVLPLLAAAQAQEAGEPRAAQERTTDVDEIVVVGVRQSIRSANEAKRQADSVVDAITAEDIGQLPDISVAESLERVTGVTSNEDRGRATQLIIRGLSADFTQTTLNGRELAGGGNGREVTLGLYPAELITRALVRKSTVADAIEGGLAGTIDLQTLRPLDRNRRLLSANLRTVYRDNQGDVEGVDNPGWRGSIAYADRFADDRFGIALGASYIDQPLITDNLVIAQPSLPRIDPTVAPGSFGSVGGSGVVASVPGAAFRYNVEGGNQKRLGLLGAVQFQPTDEWDVNVDVLYSDSEQDFRQSNLIAPIYGGLRFSDVTVDDDAVADGVSLGGNDLRVGLLTGADLSNVRLNVESTFRELNEETISGGANVRFENDRFAFSADAAYSLAEVTRPFVSNTFRRNGLTARYDYEPGDLPDFQLFGADLQDPTFAGGAGAGFQAVLLNYGDPYDLEDEILSGRFDATYKLGGAVSAVSAGVRYIERDKSRARDVDAFGAGPLRGLFAPGTPPGPANAAVIAAAGDALVPGAFGRPFDDASAIIPRGFFFVDPEAFRDAAVADLEPQGLNARDFTDGTFDVEEDAISGYVRADFDTSAGGRGLRGNVGLRVVHTDVVTTRVEPSFTAVRSDDGAIESVAIRPINEDTVVFNEIDNDYTNVLPSLNVVYDLSDDLLLRFAAGRAMSRPVFSSIGQTLTLVSAVETDEDDVSGVVLRGASGNPGLEPYESDQVDLSLEWYASDDLTLTIGGFYKSVSNFITNESSVQSFPDTNGDPVSFTINQQVNDEDAEDFYGVEVGYQQAFTMLPGWANGFGVVANYTWLETSLENRVDFPIGSRPVGRPPATRDATALCDTGVALDDEDAVCLTAVQDPNNFATHTGNLIGYYEKGGFTFRLAGQFKSDYPRQGDNLDQIRVQDDTFELDASIAIDLTDRVRFIGAATNLTNEPARVYYTDPFGGGSEDSLNRYTEFGTTYTVGLRARL